MRPKTSYNDFSKNKSKSIMLIVHTNKGVTMRAIFSNPAG